MTNTWTLQVLMGTKISDFWRLMNRKKNAASLKEIMFISK